ncbi:MAG TPA: monovalent cation/H(+) antiporter subunit G [Opitutales bacterium]|nr:monovalent cation/H(+) antiporter subunit G [Opitutales bacterium]
MTIVQNSLGVLFIVAGLTSMLVGVVGLIRLPDFFSRIHAAAMVDAAGTMLLLVGFTIFEGFTLTGAKLLLGVIFIAMTNPVGIHMLARAALRQGLKPWKLGDEEKGKKE